MSEFKVGDKVRVVDKFEEGLYCEVGTIATVTKVTEPDYSYDGVEFNIKIDWETGSCWVDKSEIEKVTYTNVKQPQFKVGDKVRVIKNHSCAFKNMNVRFEVGDITTITEVLENNNVRIGNYCANRIHITELEKVTYTNVKQPKIQGLWTSATTSRVILLILTALLVPSLIRGGLQSLGSASLAVLTFIAAVNDEMCRYEFKERTRYRKDVK